MQAFDMEIDHSRTLPICIFSTSHVMALHLTYQAFLNFGKILPCAGISECTARPLQIPSHLELKGNRDYQ